MSTSLIKKSVLIVEPNLHQKKPYVFLDQKLFKITKISNALMAADKLQKQKFDLIFLSCSFSSKKLFNFLESFKQANKTKIVPLILVVDFSQPFSIVPGLTWNNQLGLLSSISLEKELQTLLAKLL